MIIPLYFFLSSFSQEKTRKKPKDLYNTPMLQSLLNLDTSLLLSARSLAGPENAHLIRISGELIVLWWGLLLLALWFYGVYRKDVSYKIRALEIFSTIIITFILYTIINSWVPQWRIGAMELTGSNALIPHPLDNSFPSGHALFMAALLMGILVWFRKWWAITITLILWLITVSARVIWWIHYPGDILGGWFFGAIGAFIWMYIIKGATFQKYLLPITIIIFFAELYLIFLQKFSG